MRVKVVKNTRSAKDDPDCEFEEDRFVEFPLPLTIGNVYRVYGDSPNYYRIMDDAGDPVLYEKALFEIVDSTWPADWVAYSVDEGGDTYSGPACFASPDFDWEDCYYRKKATRDVFRRRLFKAVDTGE